LSTTSTACSRPATRSSASAPAIADATRAATGMRSYVSTICSIGATSAPLSSMMETDATSSPLPPSTCWWVLPSRGTNAGSLSLAHTILARGLSPLIRRPGASRQIERAVDKAHVAIGLRKVTQHAATARIDFFGQKSQVIGACQQALEQPRGIGMTPLQDIVVDQPETAGQEGALAGRQPVDTVLSLVAAHELAIDEQPLLDGAQSSLDTTVIRRQ